MERFSSKGGMMPEQIWDAPDIPAESLYLGQSAGAAQPLVWAHSEYLKLLRSAADGQVFDRIAIVEERYAVPKEKRRFRNHHEIYSSERPITRIRAGYTLRIVDAGHFRVVYSMDNWATVNEAIASMVGPAGSYVDIATTAKHAGAILFTLAWPGEGRPDRWLERNVEVTIVPST
jgi:glucoamylase